MFACTRNQLFRRMGGANRLYHPGPTLMHQCGASVLGSVRWITKRDDVRNIAVIAHVDHGKTTLVDSLLKISGTFKDARNRVMDSNDQEKERGITILAKNTAIAFPDGRRVNIVDTPGHLDFSGEVERALQMVEGFILLVDAAEGVKPGTRYVLRKALSLGLHPIVCLNKIDKEDEKIDAVVEQIQELFLETGTDDSHLDINFLYGSGRDGYFNLEPVKGGSMDPLFKAMFDDVPPPTQKTDSDPFQMLVALVDETSDGKKVAIGRVFQGAAKKGDVVKVVLGDAIADAMVMDVRVYRGVEQEPVEEANVGDIVSVVLKEPKDVSIPLKIGATLCDVNDVQPRPYRPPDEPTITLVLKKNESSWAGKESTGGAGLQMMMRLREVLRRELMVNQALRIENLDKDEITLKGRGPLHLSVLLESLRRLGFEFELKAPSVVTKTIDDVVCEPFERIVLEYPTKNGAEVINLISQKHADIVDVRNVSDDRVQAEALMAVRLMTDLSTKFNKLTAGRGTMNNTFDGYHAKLPVESDRLSGTLVANEDGTAQAYSLAGLNGLGRFFVDHGEQVYYGQVVGENTKVSGQDQPVNVTKKNEQLGGMRANAVDKANQRKIDFTKVEFGLEEYLAWVTPEEYVVVTPKSVRVRLAHFTGKTLQRGSVKAQLAAARRKK